MGTGVHVVCALRCEMCELFSFHVQLLTVTGFFDGTVLVFWVSQVDVETFNFLTWAIKGYLHGLSLINDKYNNFSAVNCATF